MELLKQVPLYQRAAGVFDRVRVMKAGYNKAA